MGRNGAEWPPEVGTPGTGHDTGGALRRSVCLGRRFGEKTRIAIDSQFRIADNCLKVQPFHLLAQKIVATVRYLL